MDADTVIIAEGLGKRYRIGARHEERLRAFVAHAIADAGRQALRRDRKDRSDAERELWAIRGVDLEIRRGEVVGIIGPNGAGKSTLMKILSRVTVPSEGRAEVRGHVGSLLEVGTGFHQELTGRENIFLSGAIMGMRRADIAAKFDEMVDFSGVGRFLDMPVKHYSSGMYVRLAFAVAAHLDPDILLLDEVLSVGDHKFQRKSLDRIRDAQRSGDTVIMVSHNLASIKTLCHRAIWMDAGRVILDASAHDCVRAYLAANGPALGRLEAEVGGSVRAHGHGERLRYVRAAVRSGLESGQLKVGTPIRVQVAFDVFEPLRDVSLGFSLKTNDGVLGLHAISAHEAEPYRDLQPGRYTVDAWADNPLNAGTYVLGLGARCHNQEIDLVTEALTIEIVDPNDSDQWAAPRLGLTWVHSHFDQPVDRRDLRSEPQTTAQTASGALP